MDTSTNEAILALFENSIYIANTREKDPARRRSKPSSKFSRSSGRASRRRWTTPGTCCGHNLRSKRYDLTKVGRYKLNQRLEVSVPDHVRVLTTEDILSLVRRLIDLPKKLGVDEESKDFAADAITLSRDPIRTELDEYEDFGNRRLRTVES